MTDREKLLAMGMNENNISNHCSDLYVKKNEISDKFVSEYEFKQNVEKFTSCIDNEVWYDIPFAYVEYYR